MGARRNLIALAVALVCAGGLLFVAYQVAQNYEVVDEGQLLPYTEGEIKEVRLFDSFNVYVEPEAEPSLDVLMSTLLLLTSGMSFVAFLALRQAPERGRKVPAFFALSSAGALYLGLDELLGLHETMGHNLQFLGELPGVSKPDDVVTTLYLIPVVAVLVLFRDVILSSRPALWLFAAGVGLFACSEVLEFADIYFGEEGLEALAALAMFAGFAALTVSQIVTPERRPPAQGGRGEDRTPATAA